MNKKSTPSVTAGPSRRGRSTRGATRPGGSVRGKGMRSKKSQQIVVEPTFGSRLRAYIPVVALPNGVFVLAAIAFALIALVATNSSMAAMPATIAQFWLVSNMSPVVGQDHTIGFVPMLPGLILGFIVARRVYSVVKDKVSLADLAVLLLCVVGIPLLLTATALAMVYDASVVFDVGVPNVGAALGKTALLHFSAMIVGMGRKLWFALADRFNVSPSVVDAGLLAGRAVAVVAAVSVAAVLLSAAVHHQAVADTFAAYDSSWGVVGSIVVSILYLPNSALAAASVMAGSSFQFGQGLFSLFGVNMVPLPPVALSAALPASAHPWAAGLMVVVGIALLYAVYRSVPTFAGAFFAAVFGAVIVLVLIVLGSGNLGVYGYVGPTLWLTVGVMAAWMLAVFFVASLAVFAMDRSFNRRVMEEERDGASVGEETRPVQRAAVDDSHEAEVLDEAAEESGEEPELQDDESAEVAGEEELIADGDEDSDETAEVKETEASPADEPKVLGAGAPVIPALGEQSADAVRGDSVESEPTIELDRTDDEPQAMELAQAEPELGGVEDSEPKAEPVAAESIDPEVVNAEEPEETLVLEQPAPEVAGEDEPEAQSSPWHVAEFEDTQEYFDDVNEDINSEALQEYEDIHQAQEPQSEKKVKKVRKGGLLGRWKKK